MSSEGGIVRFLRILIRALATTGVLAIAGGIVALVLLLESGVLTPKILAIANRAIEPATALRVSASAIRWRPWSGLTLVDADVFEVGAPDSGAAPPASPRQPPELSLGRRPLVAVENLEVGYQFLGLASRTPRIDRVRLVRPVVDLAALLRWNARRPSRDPDVERDDDGGRLGAGLRIGDLRVSGGTLLGESGLRLSGIELAGALDGSTDRWEIALHEVATTLRRGELEEKLEGHGTVALAKGILEIEDLALQSEGAHLAVRGLLVPSEAGESNVVVDGAGIDLERVADWLGSEHALLHGVVSMHLLGRGTPSRMQIEGRLANERPGRPLEEIRIAGTRDGDVLTVESMRVTAGESRADLQGSLTLEDRPKIEAFATLMQFEPFEIFAAADSVRRTALNGTARVSGEGLSRAAFTGTAEIRLAASRVRGIPLDSAELFLAGGRGEVALRHGTITRRGTKVTGTGVLGADDLVTATFEGTVRELSDLGGIFPALSPGVLDGEATARVEVDGPIRGPAAAATLSFVDAAILGARAGRLEIRADTPRIEEVPELRVHLRGEDVGYKAWLAPESEASIVVRGRDLRIESFRATSSARGEIELAGDVQVGENDAIRAAIETFRLRSPDGSLSWANEGEVRIARDSESTTVEGIDLRGSGGRIAGSVAHRTTGTTRIALTGTNVDLEDFTTYFRSPQRITGHVEFDADLTVDARDVVGAITLDLERGTWGEATLDRVAARVSSASGRIDVPEIVVRSSLGDVDVKGAVRTGSTSLRDLLRGGDGRGRLLDALELEDVVVSGKAPSLDAIRRRASWFPSPGGSGAVEATVSGRAGNPSVAFRGEIAGAAIGNAPLERLVFAGDFRDSTLFVRECSLASLGGTAAIEARWPLAWSLAHPKPRLVHDRDLDLHVAADGFPVASLTAIDSLFTMGSGPFWARASMTGSLDVPHVEGTFRVENGRIAIPLFDRPVSKGVVSGRLTTTAIEIPSFEFEDGWGDGDGGGIARGRARIDFDRLKVVDYKVDVWAEKFRYRGYAGIDAVGDGALTMTPKEISPGRKVPHFVGRFDVAKADLDERILLPPEQKPKAPPGVNVPADVDSALAAAEEEEEESEAAPVLLMDIGFAGSKNLWLRTREIDVEFAGDVTLHVTESYAGITGETHSLRGTYTFYNTKFDIERGEIEYTDPKSVGDSYIDCLATSRVLDEDVEVHVSGTLANPVIESTSSSGYSEAEIYRLLALRIKRTDPAAGPVEGQSDFNRDLLASWGALVASRFGRNLSQELGLDTFDVEVGETSGQVGVGKYLGRDFFLRYNQQVGTTDPTLSGVTQERHETPERQLLLEYRLSQIFRLQGETGTIEGDGYLNVDLMAEWGY